MKMERILSIALISSLTIVIMAGCGSGQDISGSQPTESVETTELVPSTIPQEQTPQPPVQSPEVEQTDVADTPNIVVTQAVYDFKQIGPGTSNNVARYEFTNTGSKTLNVSNVQSTCGCSKPTLFKGENKYPIPLAKSVAFEPGETGYVEVTFTAPTTKGVVTKHLYILSDDPDTPRAELIIKAEVLVKVQVSPESIELKLDQENGGIPDLVVKSTDGQEFSIASVSIANNTITVPFDREKKAAEFILKPQVDVEKLKRFNTGVIRISTTHPQSGQLMVRYTAKPMFEVSNPRYILQNIEPGTSIIRENVIRSNYGIPAEIESVESRNGYMEIESQQQDGDHIKLSIKITPQAQDTSTRRYITDELVITLKGGYNLSIRCSGWFRLE